MQVLTVIGYMMGISIYHGYDAAYLSADSGHDAGYD
jgi:hypothetical protein